jgi:hypothetical protein
VWESKNKRFPNGTSQDVTLVKMKPLSPRPDTQNMQICKSAPQPRNRCAAKRRNAASEPRYEQGRTNVRGFGVRVNLLEKLQSLSRSEQ